MTDKIIRFAAVFALALSAVFFALDAHFAKLDRDSYKEKFYGQERRAELLRADVKRAEGELAKARNTQTEKLRKMWNDQIVDGWWYWGESSGIFLPAYTRDIGKLARDVNSFLGRWVDTLVVEELGHVLLTLGGTTGDGRPTAGRRVTFCQLAEELGAADGPGDHDAETRESLRDHAFRLKHNLR